MQNAPHLVSNQTFVIPNYDWWGGPYYGIGLKVYDMMAGKLGLGASENISKKKTLEAIPTVKQEGLRGGVVYKDGQFDDARLAIQLARTIVDRGGTVTNYMGVEGLLKNEDGRIVGVETLDRESGKRYEIKAKAVINATGVFVDSILKMDDAEAKKTIVPSQGIHLVLNKEFLPGDCAVLIPKTDDGRVLFAVPWYGKVVLGTTDTLIEKPAAEPEALRKEVKFILKTAGQYLTRKPKRKDIKSIFVGLRPLAAPKSEGKNTKEISRGHKIVVSLSGLVTMTGGKWTTYRKMGQDAVDQALIVGGLDESASATRNLRIHGYEEKAAVDDRLAAYGTDRYELHKLIADNRDWGDPLHPELPYTKAEVVWAIRHEMARTVEDVLARRTRALFLDARTSIQMASIVAELMGDELNWKENKVKDEVNGFIDLAKRYLPNKKKED